MKNKKKSKKPIVAKETLQARAERIAQWRTVVTRIVPNKKKHSKAKIKETDY